MITDGNNQEIMEDRELSELMEGLEPDVSQLNRMEKSVFAEKMLVPQQTLIEEWFEILRVRPLFAMSLSLIGGAGVAYLPAAIILLIILH